MMSRESGRNLQTKLDQIKQSIQDILTTPIGSRVMRRSYGSLLPQMIDAPFNEITLLQLFAATVSALMQWEDRIIINTVSLETTAQGAYQLSLDIRLADNNQQESLSIPLNFGSTA